MNSPPTQPPVPFSEFDFGFDPALQNLFPPPPPLPSSADLFSPSETTDLFGFLDNFTWELENESALADNHGEGSSNLLPPYPPPHLSPIPEPSASNRPGTRSSRADGFEDMDMHYPHTTHPYAHPQPLSNMHAPPMSKPEPSPPPIDPESGRPKPLLTSPQKRLNHIMSEQKRRNAIRDGYAQLITLLAPAGTPPGVGMPTRGRPKGSGSRSKGRSQGKSGVLFRAVEYCRWLEEGRDALLEEVKRVEAAAGIHHP
ncbi:hypothetical protein JAAARDRAFT_29176 [Jaapia argillacea MUCL 33604]|uniref:BHLH domain-containing protein n=1 Tax=Jaapia argillacea MUCL 33604 TaxID=933084 RepID=A0A067Q7Z5_9AGAM|nr:hypothetical protein JAAARDRAFT_29176 [Jaapia argillacea MUCL 33604]